VVWLEPDDRRLLRYSVLLYGPGILFPAVLCAVGGIFGDVGALFGVTVGVSLYLVYLWTLRGRFAPSETALIIRKEEGGD